MTSLNKNKKHLFIIIFSIIILVLILISILTFYPKKIKNLIDFNNVSIVKLVKIENEEVSIDIEKTKLENILNDVTYRKRLRLIKLANSQYYEIIYNDGTKIILGNHIY